MATRKILAVCILVLQMSLNAFSQSAGMAVNADGSAPKSCAILDVGSTTKGFLPPRITHAQKLTIQSPATGLIIWCSNCGTSGELQIFNGTIWTNALGGVAYGVLPGAPVVKYVTAGNGQASVVFDAPAIRGSSPITTYTATSTPGGLKGTLLQATGGGITLDGLTNGTPYTFTVTATSAAGTGPASAQSPSATPCTIPGAPIIGTAVRGDASALVAFTAPVSNGGSDIIRYFATSDPEGIVGSLNQAGSGTVTVSGLTNNKSYTFTVKAENNAGPGPASAVSNAVTPLGLPGAPTIGTVTVGNGQATVSFTAPDSNGGQAITSYTATSSAGGKMGIVSQAGSGSITVTGLTNGRAYRFSVTATSSFGTGAASELSNSATPLGPLIYNGDTYNMVSIGKQIWLSRNLNTTKYNDGTAIPNITDGTGWINSTTGATCIFNNSAANAAIYGRLYNWYAVDNNDATKVASNGGKNICPAGWHVPSNEEWTELQVNLGGDLVAGGKLKEVGTTHWTTPNTGADNSSGFTALPGSYRDDNGEFPSPTSLSGRTTDLIGQVAFWWSKTPDTAVSISHSTTSNAFSWYIKYNNSQFNNGYQSFSKIKGQSVRCLSDDGYLK